MIYNLLFPRRCPICDSILEKGQLICEECALIPRIVPAPRCLKCGKHIDSGDEMLCLDCRKNPRCFASGVALYEYDSIHDSINDMKNGGRPEYATFYGRMMADKLGSVIKSYKPDAFIPVPLHESKMRKRGYNQASLLADAMSERLSIPVRDDILQRIVKTKEQKKMTDLQRQNNLVGAFHIAQNDVKLYNVVLVDDVYTTGSTLNEAAKTLREGGVQNVYFVALAIGRGYS